MKISELIKEIQFDAQTEKIPKVVLKRMVSCMEEVGDIRSPDMIDYPLPYVLLISFLAILSGVDSWEDMQTFAVAYKTKLNGILPKYKNIGVSSHDTFR